VFTEKSNDRTSLRDIAERLGTTKAALYYHFERRQDMLLELHLRLHAFGRDVLDQLDHLEDGQARADAWPGLLDRFITRVANNRELVLLHQRNLNAFEQLHDSESHQLKNDYIEQQFRRFLASPDIPLADRVRMACSIGAVMGGPIGPGAGMFDDVPADELAELVRDAVADLLAPTHTATPTN
jgi:AcrR family transcriptional regulator